MGAVLITRPQPAADNLAERLRLAGIEAYVAPMIEYESLECDVGAVSQCNAIVFTSVQGVTVFAEKSSRRNLPVFAVGAATAEAARAAGFSHIEEGDEGVAQLAKIITARKDALRLQFIFYASGEHTAEDLKSLLPAEIAVIHVPVYAAHLVSHIPPEIERCLIDGTISRVALFSPRMAAHFSQIMQRRHLRDSIENIETVCLSPRVAEALGEARFRAVSIAEKPDIDSVFKILTSPVPRDEKRDTIQADRRDPGKDTMTQAENKKPPAEDADYEALHEKQQKHKIRREKMAFVMRTFLSIVAVSGLVVYAAMFLLAPEYVSSSQSSGTPPARSAPRGPEKPHASFGAALSGKIASVQNAVDATTTTVTRLPDAAVTVASNSKMAEGAGKLMHSLSLLRHVNSTVQGRQAIGVAMADLKSTLAAAPADMQSLDEAVSQTKDRHAALEQVLGPVDDKDLGAAAMLLTLSELRSKVADGRPFEDDLALLQKFYGDDPAMQQSIARLAPYAESGVLSRATLQQEFEGAAADIVMAKFRGEDLSVKERVMNRVKRLVRVRKLNDPSEDISGPGTEPAVARAQLLLNAGDVKGAIRELQTLEGEEAQAAGPWMEQAAGAAVAGDLSTDLATQIMQKISTEEGFSLEGMIPNFLQQMMPPSSVYLSPAMQGSNNGMSGFGGMLGGRPAAPFPLSPE
jgi:uroporphyrinogen-III synthase